LSERRDMRRIIKSIAVISLLPILLIVAASGVSAQENKNAAQAAPPNDAATNSDQTQPPPADGESAAAPDAQETAAPQPLPPESGSGNEKLPPNFEITRSGLLIEHVKPKEKQLLRINPELGFGGVVGKYRALGGFAWWQFDGGLGFTVKDDWHLRANVRAFRMAHEHTFLPDPYFPAPLMGATKTFGAWFVQPSIYAMYCLGHYEKYHYFFPMDLFIGAKLGMDFYLKPAGLPVSEKRTEINYGIAFLWRWYFHRRIGAAPYAEVSTVDYMRNWFVSYGISAFWDFDIIPYREPLGKEETTPEKTPEATENEAETGGNAPLQQ